jgi:CRP-like cAMP-binding protein
MRRVPQERIDLLRSVALFRGCSDGELAKLDRLLDDVEVPVGEILIKQGARGASESFVIVAGEAEVLIDDRRVSTVGPGDFFGEMAMLDLQPRTATVRALTPMHLLVISPATFTEFLEQPTIAVKMLKGLVQRLREAESAKTAR